MKPAILIIGFALAGVFGALAGTLLRSEPAPVVSAPAGSARDQARLDSLESELARLSRGQTELLRMLRERDAAPASASAPAPVAADASVPEPLAAAAPAGEDALKEAVREVVQEQAREAREARELREAKMAEERETRMLERMQADLQLTPYQQEQVRDILGRRRAAFLALREKLRSTDGPPSDEDRQAFQKVREAADAELQQVLSTAQYETFKQSEGDRGGPGRNRPTPR